MEKSNAMKAAEKLHDFSYDYNDQWERDKQRELGGVNKTLSSESQSLMDRFNQESDRPAEELYPEYDQPVSATRGLIEPQQQADALGGQQDEALSQALSQRASKFYEQGAADQAIQRKVAAPEKSLQKKSDVFSRKVQQAEMANTQQQIANEQYQKMYSAYLKKQQTRSGILGTLLKGIGAVGGFLIGGPGGAAAGAAAGGAVGGAAEGG